MPIPKKMYFISYVVQIPGQFPLFESDIISSPKSIGTPTEIQNVVSHLHEKFVRIVVPQAPPEHKERIMNSKCSLIFFKELEEDSRIVISDSPLPPIPSPFIK